MPGTLYLVGTPIGNLQDITDRARRVLASVDLIAAEDTRRTGRLLQSLGIERKRLMSFFEGNELQRLDPLLEELRSGRDLAVVTDAGMPSISDPGYRLVAACVDAGVPVDVVPGPSSVLAALVISGLPTDRFAFEGFLPRTGRARTDRLKALADEPRTIVLFESPKRAAATLEDLLDSGGDRRVALVRELTKLHQEVIRGDLTHVLSQLRHRELKGEVVLVVEGRTPAGEPDLGAAVEHANRLVEEGARKRDAAKQAAALANVAATDVYQALVDAEKMEVRSTTVEPGPR